MHPRIETQIKKPGMMAHKYWRGGFVGAQKYFTPLKYKLPDLTSTVNMFWMISRKVSDFTAKQKTNTYLAILCDLFGMVKWPFKGLSDLQLGNQNVTLNHLVTDKFAAKGEASVMTCDDQSIGTFLLKHVLNLYSSNILGTWRYSHM